MKKKLSIMTAILMTASAPIPVCTDAVPSQEYCDGMFADCTEIEDTEWLENSFGSAEKVFAREHEDSSVTVYFVRSMPEYISFNTPDDTDIVELADKVKAYDERLFFYSRPALGGFTYYSIGVRSDDKLTAKEAKELYRLLEDDVLSFEYHSSRQVFDYASYWHLPAFVADLNTANAEETEQKLSDWLESSGTEARLEKENLEGVNYYQIIPDKKLTVTERLDMAHDIVSSTGLMLYGVMPEDTGTSTEKIIDIMNAVDGDANNDGQITVADAVAVLQCIANTEKYPMSEQGRFNADIDGEDGITGGDASAIQKIDAGIWDES